MDKRKKAGQPTSVVPDKNSKNGKFFFTLKLKGDKPPITEKAIWANYREMGMLDHKGNLKVKDKPCEIENQLTMRIKDGNSVQAIVPARTKKEGEEGVFNLKLKGELPKLKKQVDQAA